MLVGIAAITVGLIAALGGHGDRGIFGGVLLVAGGGLFLGASIYGIFYFRRRS